jgi:GR25 family glycosyltransferase involved in LPS biosynthesis
MEKQTIYYILAAMACVLIVYSCWPSPVTIDDIWVINLEKDAKRWKHIEAQAKGLNIHRWDATYGKKTSIDEAAEWGVTQLVTSIKGKGKLVQHKAGEVGCWMSHKRLLTHLASLNVPDNYGHLILEDDVDLHAGFMGEFTIIAQQIPKRWDMVYLSINRPKGNTQLSSRILKANTRKNPADGNWGTQAYLVRHGSIRKILSHLHYMIYEIDIQYNMAFDAMDVYIIDPVLIKLNPELSKESSIQ